MSGRARVVAVAASLALLAACAGTEARARGSADVLRLGVFATLTHAPAHVAIATGMLDRALDPARLDVTVFDSGTEAGMALLAGSIDAAYLGPWPTALLYLRSGRVAVVSGAASGGVSLVVRSDAGIRTPEDLHGARIAIPGLNNTQEVALRSWLQGNGLQARDEGGDVAVESIGEQQLLPLFEHDRLDGAWVPEPYPTYLAERGVAEELVRETDLWPGGEFVTTNLVVSTAYMDAHPDLVRALVEANVEAIRLCRDQPERAAEIERAELRALGAPDLGRDVFDAAWARMTFTWDPIPSSLRLVVAEARDVGLLGDLSGDVAGVYRLDDLDDVLNDEGLPPVEVAA